MANNISNYKAKDWSEMNTLTRSFKNLGYQVIIHGEKVRKLEKGDHTVIITREK